MPAGVADAGQRIVLGVEDDEASAGAEVGGEGGVDAVGLGGDDDAQVGKGRGGEERGEDGVGVVLVVGQLRVGVDLTEYYDEISVWSLRLLWTWCGCSYLVVELLDLLKMRGDGRRDLGQDVRGNCRGHVFFCSEMVIEI